MTMPLSFCLTPKETVVWFQMSENQSTVTAKHVVYGEIQNC